MKNKIICCYLSTKYTPFTRGAEVSLNRLTTGLLQYSNIYPLIITPRINEQGDLLKSKDKKFNNILRVGSPKFIPASNPTSWRRTAVRIIIKKLMEYQNEVDLIYINSAHNFCLYPNFFNKILQLKKPIILKITNTSEFPIINKSKKLLFSTLYKDNISIHCISKQIKEKSLRLGFSNNQLLYCPNPIDINKFSTRNTKNRKHLKGGYKIANNDLIFIFVGVFSPQKNIPKLINIFNKLKKQRKDSKLVIIGYVIHPEMASIIKDLKKDSKNIYWIDKIPNNQINEYLKTADFFITASQGEGMSNALLEAMASGLVPIAPITTSGMKDLIQANQSGFLYDMGNLDPLINQIKTINKNRIKIMGRKARIDIKKTCNVHNIVNIHSKFYKSKI